MSPDAWQAFTSPDPARDHGLQAEWALPPTVPGWIWAVVLLIWILTLWWGTTAGRWPSARTWRRWERTLLDIASVAGLGLGLYAVGQTGGLMATEVQVHQARVAAASAERAMHAVLDLPPRVQQLEDEQRSDAQQLRRLDERVWDLERAHPEGAE